MRIRSSLRGGALARWGPVVFVLVVAQTRIGLERDWVGSEVGLALTALLLAAPLVWRREHPLLCAAGVAIALPVQVTIGGSLHFGAFVAVLFAAFAAGRWVPTLRGSAAGVALLLAGATTASLGGVVDAAEGLLDSPDELVFPLFYVTAAVATGRVVGTVSRQAAELTRLNAALEEEYGAAARLTVATERMRLSRDLHDSVAHTLMITVVQAELAESALDEDPARARDALRRVQEAGRTGLAELRDALRMLRAPEDAAPPPGLTDLPALARVLDEAGLAVDLEVDPDVATLPPELSTALFRVAQESLTNVTKHSVASRARVEVTVTGGRVTLEVSDPGPPATATQPPGGHGLVGMRERLAPLGGSVHAGPLPDTCGWVVTAAVPMAQATKVAG